MWGAAVPCLQGQQPLSPWPLSPGVLRTRWLCVTPLSALRVGRAGSQRRPAHLAPRDTAGLLSPGLPSARRPRPQSGPLSPRTQRPFAETFSHKLC